MMKLEINGKEYEFKFSIRFLRDLRDKKTGSVNGVEVGFGDGFFLNQLVADRDVVSLFEILLSANHAVGGKLTANALDEYLDDENTDVEKLTDEVISELSRANATASKVKRAMTAAQQ